jgi:hypothetical protein
LIIFAFTCLHREVTQYPYELGQKFPNLAFVKV